MTLSIGSKLGRYEIRSQLGGGGMGEVYLAEDPKLDRKVAIKFLPQQLLGMKRPRAALSEKHGPQLGSITRTSA